MSLFGSSGIRGIVNEKITPELLIRIGSAMAYECDEVIVGKDVRTSGDMAVQALAAGLTSNGANCHLAGLVPTPTLARCAAGYDGGLIVTASHNPPHYNGVKMWNPDGSAFGSLQMKTMESRIIGETTAGIPWSEVGTVFRREGCIRDHIEAIKSDLPPVELSVVVDCGNGAASLVTPSLLREMGCRVVGINCHPDGHFPGRPSEPSEENLEDLKGLVVRRGADIGIAHDGDGDRMVAVDAEGRFVGGDSLLALFATRFSEGDIVAPINASMVLDDIVSGRVVRTRVGDVFVSEALRRRGIPFGGEPSGTFIFSKQTLCPDGVYAAALLAVMVAGSPLAELIGSLPSYPSARTSLHVPEDRMQSLKRRLREEMEGIQCARLITEDGFRAEFPDGWLLIRISGTEPKVRITVEARDEGEMRRLLSEGDRIVRRCLG